MATIRLNYDKVMTTFTIDIVCLMHGKRKSEHDCLYCSLCYRDLTVEECNVLESGELESVCTDCAEKERAMQTLEKVDYCAIVVDALSTLIRQRMRALQHENVAPGSNADASDTRITDLSKQIERLRACREEFEDAMADLEPNWYDK